MPHLYSRNTIPFTASRYEGSCELCFNVGAQAQVDQQTLGGGYSGNETECATQWTSFGALDELMIVPTRHMSAQCPNALRGDDARPLATWPV